MGGEGAMAAANSSLKLNRGQLKKRKGRKVYEGSYANVAIRKFPKATSRQLRIIREKILLENRRSRARQITFIALTIFLIVSIIIFFI